MQAQKKWLRNECCSYTSNYTLFPRFSTCSQITAWSQGSAGSKEDMMLCLLNNKSQMSTGCQMSAGTLIRGNMVYRIWNIFGLHLLQLLYNSHNVFVHIGISHFSHCALVMCIDCNSKKKRIGVPLCLSAMHAYIYIYIHKGWLRHWSMHYNSQHWLSRVPFQIQTRKIHHSSIEALMLDVTLSDHQLLTAHREIG